MSSFSRPQRSIQPVHWDFLWTTLEHIRVGKTLLGCIMKLYSNPLGQIRINGQLSSSFSIRYSTKPGCPLSPLLYIIISMEPLAIALRCNADICGIAVGREAYKLALYADDLFMYVSSPTISLPIILKEFESFCALSNFKVRITQYVALAFVSLHT